MNCGDCKLWTRFTEQGFEAFGDCGFDLDMVKVPASFIGTIALQPTKEDDGEYCFFHTPKGGDDGLR